MSWPLRYLTQEPPTRHELSSGDEEAGVAWDGAYRKKRYSGFFSRILAPRSPSTPFTCTKDPATINSSPWNGHHNKKELTITKNYPPKNLATPAFLLLYLFLFPRRGSRPCQRCQGRARIERRPSKLGRQLAPRKIVVTMRPLRERYIRCHSDKNRYYT